MRAATNDTWQRANQRYLMAALGVVREALQRRASSGDSPSADAKSSRGGGSAAQNELSQAAEDLPSPSALDTLAATFGLSHFEQDVLLMCAGVELDSSFASLVSSLRSDATRSHPTFSLALAALPDAHWSALIPAAPLRYWRLVGFGDGGAMTTRSLHIDEQVLHYLAGVQYVNERLCSILEPVFPDPDLVPTHRGVVDRLVHSWSQLSQDRALPTLQLCGEETSSMKAIAACACADLGLNLYALSAFALPDNLPDLAELARLWEREAALKASVLFLDCREVEATDEQRLRTILRFCDSIRSALIISSRERSFSLLRSVMFFDVEKPTPDEQYALWQGVLGQQAAKLDGQLKTVVSQFNLGAQAIRSAGSEVLTNLASDSSGSPESEDRVGAILWDVCCSQSRPHLDDLAQRIEPRAEWPDLILPDLEKETLGEIAAHVRQRRTVYHEWGFEAVCSRGLGISTLFAGGSGTGKTMAAEVLANELHLHLYKIDLSQVVNKYIGQTEKNLKRVFDAAEGGGVILLFDEADALFGKRSEVKDSHDRYANIEVSYLLQRMESYRGLAILTTNMRHALDKAFLRRLRFVVQFPFPDAAQRAEIWRRVFPADTPTEGIDVTRLSRLNVAGGNIRNIALHAAFLAAERGEPVRMNHVSRAARVEYAKLEKPMGKFEVES